jgi:hypothetical protein
MVEEEGNPVGVFEREVKCMRMHRSGSNNLTCSHFLHPKVLMAE